MTWRDGDTAFHVAADEARYERVRAEAEEPWLLDPDDGPTRDDLVPVYEPRPRTERESILGSQDPWLAETIQPGTRVFHVSRVDEPDAVAKGTGVVVESRRLGSDVEYRVAYDRGGCGWHGSTDVRVARSEVDRDPF